MSRDVSDDHRLVGDLIWARAMEHASYINDSTFISLWRDRNLPLARYVKHIAAMYPCVVGFNRALIHSISKLDNVRDSRIVAGLAEQLLEEQEHNDIWRAMLLSHGVDHEALYAALLDYLDNYSSDGLSSMTAHVTKALRDNRKNITPRVFVNPPFPEPVLALYHHMFTVSKNDGFSFWCHFASQSAMEATIYEVVSASCYPGVAGHPDLDRGGKSVLWWKEHSRGEGGDGQPTTEEKHLYLSRRALNKSSEANAARDQLLTVVEDTLHLFAASIVAHDAACDVPFPSDALPEICRAEW